MSAYPESMRYFLDEVNGASFNVFKLEPQNSNSAVANRILRFTLPANSLLNLRSFSLWFNMSAEAEGSDPGAGAQQVGGRLPAGIDRVVQRIEVTCGGVQLSAGSNFYNVLQQAKRSLEGEDMDSQLGHPYCVRVISPVDNNGVAVGTYPTNATCYNISTLANSNEKYPAANNATQFCISKWDGFLGECAPSILDSSLVPDIVVSIFLDDDSILASIRGTYLDQTGEAVAWAAGHQQCTDVAANRATWHMKNIHATIECIGLSDGVLDALEASTIAQEGSLRVPFKQYFSFQDTTANTMRFNVATGSLDRIWIAHRVNNYNALAGLARIEGSKYANAGAEGAAAVDDTGINLPDQGVIQPLIKNVLAAGINSYDSGGVMHIENSGCEEYVTLKFLLQEPPNAAIPGAQRYQLSLNASYYPQFQATYEEMLGISRNSVEKWRDDRISLFTQRSDFSTQCARFCLPNTGVRKISGFDTRSVSLNGYYNMYNVDAARTVNLFCECTSVLRIGEARQLEVVQ